MNDDLISRQAVIETTVKKNSVWNTITNASGDNLEQIINSVPTANVVEVVRCKDCRHYKRNVPCVGGYYNGCDEWLDEGNPITVYDNDFCSYGERAEK